MTAGRPSPGSCSSPASHRGRPRHPRGVMRRTCRLGSLGCWSSAIVRRRRMVETAVRAVTVVPGVAGSLRVEEGPEPGSGSGSVLVEAIAVGICGTDVEIVDGALRVGAPGAGRLDAGSRVARARARSGAERAPGGGAWWGSAPAGPVAVPELRVGEWDMCSQRAVHRARHQTGRRVHVRALADRPEYAVRVDPQLGVLGVLPEPTTVVVKAWEHVLSDRPAHVLAARDGAGHRGRADRPARRADRHAAWCRRARARPVRHRVEAGSGRAAWRDVSHGRGRRVGLRPDIVLECTGREQTDQPGDSRVAARRHRLPHRRRPRDRGPRVGGVGKGKPC